MSENKFWLTFWLSAFATVVAIALVIHNYAVVSMPLERTRIVSEHNLKMACIRSGGNWQAVDHDNKAPYGCAMR